MPTPVVRQSHPHSTQRVLRLGSVSYLNAKPLIWGLDQCHDLRLLLDVPSSLLSALRQQQVDVALLPVIDYQRIDALRIIPAGGIACEGPTLTVRIFSRIPLDQIDTLACDTDSHTSVALARVILAERHGIHPRLVPWTAAHPSSCPARLLIGDKVVCEEPVGFNHQLDLGQAWNELTHLPFVFAVWMARPEVELGDLPTRLAQAKRQGLANIDPIIRRWALPRGWPETIARQYLCHYLQYDITPRHLEAISLFHRLASQHGVLPTPLTPLRVEPASHP